MRARRLAAAASVAALWSLPILAQPATTPATPVERQNPAPGPNGNAAPTGFWERANLFGDLGGVRTQLGNYGISLGLTETSEVLGNVSGGVHQGADYDGVTLMSLGIDTSKAGWAGGIFNVSAFQIHGRNLSTDNLYTLQTASGIEADRSTRLWELWYQQTIGKIDIKLGQQSLDQEFMTSLGSSLFINTAMGWAVLPSVDLYAGGPAYPLSSLGVRLRGQLADNLTVLGGVFDDNPPGGPFYNDSQVRGAEQSGTKFDTGTGALFIAELQYGLNAPPQAGAAQPAANTPSPSPGLPGTYKLGFWFDTGAFPDQRFAQSGLSLANPASSGIARLLRNNFSAYAVMDQTVWRPDPAAARTLGVFARIMGSPSDRNLVDFAANGGLTLKAPMAGRDNDTAGLGFGYTHISGRAASLDRDYLYYNDSYVPVRSSETFIELTYQAQVAPWWLLQPNVQYVFNPGGGVANPLDPTTRIKNELVLGLRTNITF